MMLPGGFGNLHNVFGIRPPVFNPGQPTPMRPPIQQFPQPVIGPTPPSRGLNGPAPQAPNIVQGQTPDPWRRMLGSFDKIKKTTTVKRSGAYKLKAGERVSPKQHGKRTSLASLK